MNNDQQVWKEFEQNPLTHSAFHYLEAIHKLREEQGYARLTDVARSLEISSGSCSLGLKNLKKKGWVQEDANRMLLLSAVGERLVIQVEKNCTLLIQFFTEVLGVSQEQAEIDACKMEHLLSPQIAERLEEFLNSQS